MLGKDNIDLFFASLDRNINQKISIFLIGGGAMALKGLKPATIDIDIVINTKAEFEILKSGLLRLGLRIDEEIHDINVYKQAVMVFLKEASRIDVFIKNIVGMLDFTKAMQERSVLYKQYANLKVNLCSNEDIFLLKSLSDREKDIPDNKMLIDTGLDWNIIIKECVNQHKKEVKWIFWLFEQICRIENRYNISIISKNKIFKECLKNWENKPSDFMHEFDEETIKKSLPRSKQKEILK